MQIQLRWLPLRRLADGTSQNLIFTLRNVDNLPRNPGVYIFGRMKSGAFIPIYIGKAGKLRGRIIKQLNNVRLMKSLEASPGTRVYLAVGVYLGKSGQKQSSVLNIVERRLIEYALAEGYDIVNVQGTRRPHHTITFLGNKRSRKWLPRQMSVPKTQI